MRRRGKSPMTLRILLAALVHRKSQIAIACLSVALGTALVTAAVSLRGTQQTLERELSRYGANLLVLPSPGRSLDETSLTALDQMMGSGDLESYSPPSPLRANIGHRDGGGAGGRRAGSSPRLPASWDRPSRMQKSGPPSSSRRLRRGSSDVWSVC